MRIGELSRRTGVSVRSIRHYDDNGLLGARRGENGYRIFDESAVRRVLRIKQLIHHGLTVEEIRPMAACLDAAEDDERICDHVIQLYEHKLRRLDEEIAALRAQRNRVAERLRALSLRRTIEERLALQRAGR
jgi:DNA-binding transcriptional MerR regulator